MPDQRYFRAGSCAESGFTVSITPARAGWRFSGLRVLELSAGRTHVVVTGDSEMLVLPLSGACTVACDGERMNLDGRAGVFDRVTDFAYVPRDAQVELTSERGGRFALPSARAARRLPPRYGAAEDVPVELRGAGSASRQVNNFCSPDTFETDKLIAVEVLTPAGNWSSYPPHKHDERRAGEEELEEVYYFEVAEREGAPGFGFQRVYASSDDRPIDVCTEVRTGDVILIPYGYHGPSMAAPGYDLYYLNVMAGPAEVRAWRFCDDPAHAWIRDAWRGQPVDARLPMTSARSRA